MAKITRYNGNLEAPASAALGTERTIFGTGSQSDDLTDQFNAFLLRGWGIVGPSDQPTLQDFNAMGFTLGQIHAYLHQMGVAEYNATQEYHTGSIANVAGVLYVSLVDTNVGNAPASSPAQWSPQSSHGMITFSSPGVTAWAVPIAMQLGIISPKVTVVGAGGGNQGTSGGASSFGAFISATGGGGSSGASGANGGTGSGGALNINGGGGGNANIDHSGDGGGSMFGSSGLGRTSGMPGAGAGGALNNQGGGGGGGSAISVISLVGVTSVSVTVGAPGTSSVTSAGAGLVIIEW